MSKSGDYLIIGSRGSQLALWQTEWVKSELCKKFPSLDITILTVATTGDKVLDSPLAKIGDKGVFTKEIELALLEQRIDLAVHSLKDLPTMLPQGLTIGAITAREDVRDVFIAHPKKSYKGIHDIPQGGTIATGSLRRRSQLMNWRRDLNIVDIRGNLQTRFAKLDASDWDGMILALAGVKRLGLEERITEIIPLERMLPAVGQGALAIEVRENDREILHYISELASAATTFAALAERAILRHLEGGCQIPIGAYGRIVENILHLDALVGSIDGKSVVRGKIHGQPEQAESLGEQLGKILLQSGGKEILAQIRRHETNEVPLV